MTMLMPKPLMMPTVDEIAWMDGSLCTRVDPELWTSGRPCDQQVAAGFCHGCEVEPVCRDWALEHHEMRGTWGGMTSAQRKRVLSETDPDPVLPPPDAAKV
jgi:WhiB family redox-sensing transcriptional regulator